RVGPVSVCALDPAARDRLRAEPGRAFGRGVADCGRQVPPARGRGRGPAARGWGAGDDRRRPRRRCSPDPARGETGNRERRCRDGGGRRRRGACPRRGASRRGSMHVCLAVLVSPPARRLPAPMKVLVTGATGFLGSRAARLFEENGHEVVRLARPGGAERVGATAHVWRDAGDPAARELIAGCGAVLHFAGIPDPARAREDRARADEPIVIAGDPERSRDFVYVDDGLAAIEGLVAEGRWNETVLIASGRSTPLRTAAELVRDEAGSSSPIETPGGELPAGENES